ncbi:MAG: nucleotide exchange factor GrpE [Acidobacteriota bacterium]
MSEERPSRNRDKGDGREPHFSVIDRRPSYRDGAAVEPERRFPTYVQELKARAEAAERRAREISAAYRRLDEERDAFRERLRRDLERRVEFARAEMMRKVIAVLDDLDRAIDSAAGPTEPRSLLRGVVLIRDHLLRVLSSEGVEEVETVGRPFDPIHAEAVATEETEDPARDNLVVEEMLKGYTLRGTPLRPARVKVARCRRRAPEASEAGAAPEAPDS